MERRNTIQRAMVLEAVKSLQNHPTADEVYAFIIKNHPTIGKGTVYRNLNILAETGQIIKIPVPNGADCFDHTVREHYHIRCMKCGRLFDVDMEEKPDLVAFIKDTHGMRIEGYDILFRGVCSACRGNRTAALEIKKG